MLYGYFRFDFLAQLVVETLVFEVTSVPVTNTPYKFL